MKSNKSVLMLAIMLTLCAFSLSAQEFWISTTSPPDPCPATFGYGGQTYSTVMIGTQCWMAENLNIGARINGVINQSNDGIIQKYCYDDLETNCNIYGGLYQWDEMMTYTSAEGVKGICPNGWHLPTYGEWTILTSNLGGPGVAGGQMKELGFAHWITPNTGATNTSGFTGLPGGGLDYFTGSFNRTGLSGYFWSSTQDDASSASRLDLSNTNDNAYMFSRYKTHGFSVRCLKN
jgi:uncharacterized protein (TIGR02145 family)